MNCHNNKLVEKQFYDKAFNFILYFYFSQVVSVSRPVQAHKVLHVRL